MNILRENREGNTALIKVTLGQADYQAPVEKTLKEYRRKANIPGFRPGMVPMGMINKLYAKGVLAEETYKMASNAAFEFIEKEKIEYVGDVMPAEEQKSLDFDKDKDFEFVFEIGIAPEVNIELSGKDEVTHYVIEPDKQMIENYRSNFVRRHGRLEDTDTVTSDEALSVTLDNEQINVADAYVGLVSMDENQRKPFIGKKVGDEMEVDVNELYKTTSQRAAILQVSEDELAGIDPKFKLTITKIRKFIEPELNAEFFTTEFPDGGVTDEAGFETFIYEQVARDVNRESDYVLTYEIRKMLLDKAALTMPEEFLKKWLFAVNEGKYTMEQIEADFTQFLDMMRWNLIQKFFAEKFEIKVSPEDALAEARNYAAMQFAQYGMMNLQDEILTNYAHQMLQNKDEARKIYDRLFEQKIIEAVKPLLNVVDKKVTPEEFGKAAENLTR